MTPDADAHCLNCSAPVPAAARFCPSCGARRESSSGAPQPVELGESAALDEFDSLETQKLASQFYERQVELVHSCATRAQDLLQEVEGIGPDIRALERAPFTPERTRSVQSLLEDLEAFGERWEELQHQYNRESESLEEDFLDQASELEVDLELPLQIQERINGEVQNLTTALDRLQERLEDFGARGNSLIAQPEGRHFGTKTTKGPGSSDLAVLILALVTSGVLSQAQRIGTLPATLIAAPLLLAGAFLLMRWNRAAR